MQGQKMSLILIRTMITERTTNQQTCAVPYCAVCFYTSVRFLYKITALKQKNLIFCLFAEFFSRTVYRKVRGSNSIMGKIFYSPKTSRLTLGRTQPPIQGAPRFLSGRKAAAQ
jgi:hypothetical protein